MGIYSNLRKPQRIRGVVAKVLGETGAPNKAREMMYKVVFQAVLLCGRTIWVVTDMMMLVIEVFHHSIVRLIYRMTARKGNGGEWNWASVEVALDITGILTIRECVRERQAKITEYV